MHWCDSLADWCAQYFLTLSDFFIKFPNERSTYLPWNWSSAAVDGDRSSNVVWTRTLVPSHLNGYLQLRSMRPSVRCPLKHSFGPKWNEICMPRVRVCRNRCRPKQFWVDIDARSRSREDGIWRAWKRCDGKNVTKFSFWFFNISCVSEIGDQINCNFFGQYTQWAASWRSSNRTHIMSVRLCVGAYRRKENVRKTSNWLMTFGQPKAYTRAPNRTTAVFQWHCRHCGMYFDCRYFD